MRWSTSSSTRSGGCRISIKVGELLPSLRNGSNLSGRGLKIARNGKVIDPGSVNWGSTDPRLFEIYQPPGPGNALGIVKFLFPNKHAVYLHDTPSKALFNNAVRDYSHGCIRVRNPLKLAEVLFAKDRSWGEENISSMIEGGENRPVTLNRKIPVHITYFTAKIDAKGKLTTYKDPYGVDRRVIMALNGKVKQLMAEAAAEKSRIAEKNKFTVASSDDDPGLDSGNWFWGNSRKREAARRRDRSEEVSVRVERPRRKKAGLASLFDDDPPQAEVINVRTKTRAKLSSGGGQPKARVKLQKPKKKGPAGWALDVFNSGN